MAERNNRLKELFENAKKAKETFDHRGDALKSRLENAARSGLRPVKTIYELTKRPRERVSSGLTSKRTKLAMFGLLLLAGFVDRNQQFSTYGFERLELYPQILVLFAFYLFLFTKIEEGLKEAEGSESTKKKVLHQARLALRAIRAIAGAGAVYVVTPQLYEWLKQSESHQLSNIISSFGVFATVIAGTYAGDVYGWLKKIWNEVEAEIDEEPDEIDEESEIDEEPDEIDEESEIDEEPDEIDKKSLNNYLRDKPGVTSIITDPKVVREKLRELAVKWSIES